MPTHIEILIEAINDLYRYELKVERLLWETCFNNIPNEQEPNERA